MPKTQAAASLPPTLGITDPHTRAFCDALASAWALRNNGAGKDSERFVRKGEVEELAAQTVVGLLSGAADPAMASLQPGTGTAAQTYQQVLTAVERLITGSKAYEFLRTPVQQIAVPTQQVDDLLARIETETADRIAAIEAEALARGSGITSEQTAREAADGVLQTQIDTIVAIGGGDTATILAALSTEQTARIAADTAEATERTTLATQIRGAYTGTDSAAVSSGLLYSERQARISSVSAVVTDLTALTARVGTAESAIITEQTVRASAVSALNSSVTTLTSRVGTAEAAIITNNNTRSTKDNSLAQAINTIWARIGGASALIQDGALASVTPSAAIATKWNQVQAAVTDPNTGLVNATSIKQDLNVYASKVDGTLNATWAVRANVNGIVSGVSLTTSAGAGSAPGTVTSAFLIMADKLALVNPSNTALRPVPFSVDSSGNAVFAGTVYAAAGTFGGALNAATGTFDGTVRAGAVVSGTLNAAKICVGTASGAVTFFDASQPSVPLQSAAEGTYQYNGDPGASIVTGSAVDFRNNSTLVGIARRIRTGLVTFTIIASGTMDHYFSIWYRRNSGAWQFIYSSVEVQESYGAASVAQSVPITVNANDRIEFGMSTTNAAGAHGDPSRTGLYYAQITVTGRNF